jgi:hypothetical protein
MRKSYLIRNSVQLVVNCVEGKLSIHRITDALWCLQGA